ncbi:peptide/nickel transport system permease protein [Rhizobiales bacterium GAS191]|jgi:peptide/nickel transport system permease protein|nr:peptide/nickel transport system permease protein [Rhizobiales bacterium GAS113]SEE14365.1 peptide/nickel transport system permease protein [Rhizobiales bacterium GAS188]SEE42870.1 peptide/nickel transport system permease protein [Rhizobiales bacterium GAS191]
MSWFVPKLIAQRLVIALVTLAFVSVAVFLATEILPGDVAEVVLGQSATPEAVAGLRAALHLDQPAYLRYFIWLHGLLTGDPGRSLVNNLPVATLIGSRLSNSLLLAAVTAVFCVPVALTLGITSAIWRNSAYDRLISLVTLSAVAVPEFFIATLAVVVFAVHLHWLPALSTSPSIDSVGRFFRVFTLPVLSLSCVIIAQMVRMSRSAVLDALRQPYVEMALLKGAGPARVVLVHALPNAIGPIANSVALSLSHLLGGVIIVETIFNYPGLAHLLVDGVATRDMPLVQAVAMMFCAGYLILVTIADIAGIVSNPKLRFR